MKFHCQNWFCQNNHNKRGTVFQPHLKKLLKDLWVWTTSQHHSRTFCNVFDFADVEWLEARPQSYQAINTLCRLMLRSGTHIKSKCGAHVRGSSGDGAGRGIKLIPGTEILPRPPSKYLQLPVADPGFG